MDENIKDIIDEINDIDSTDDEDCYDDEIDEYLSSISSSAYKCLTVEQDDRLKIEVEFIANQSIEQIIMLTNKLNKNIELSQEQLFELAANIKDVNIKNISLLESNQLFITVMNKIFLHSIEDRYYSYKDQKRRKKQKDKNKLTVKIYNDLRRDFPKRIIANTIIKMAGDARDQYSDNKNIQSVYFLETFFTLGRYYQALYSHDILLVDVLINSCSSEISAAHRTKGHNEIEQIQHPKKDRKEKYLSEIEAKAKKLYSEGFRGFAKLYTKLHKEFLSERKKEIDSDSTITTVHKEFKKKEIENFVTESDVQARLEPLARNHKDLPPGY